MGLNYELTENSWNLGPFRIKVLVTQIEKPIWRAITFAYIFMYVQFFVYYIRIYICLNQINIKYK